MLHNVASYFITMVRLRNILSVKFRANVHLSQFWNIRRQLYYVTSQCELANNVVELATLALLRLMLYRMEF